jgi:hypothetical protein
VIRTLAFDDDIDVARPVLRDSGQIEEADLVANANTKSQQHLLAISQRKALSEAVTDVLVTRGDPQVVHSVAGNDKARFSFAGFRVLVRRASDDDDLTTIIGLRSDLPRQQLLRLLDTASANVRARLLAQNPDSGSVVESAVEEVGHSIRDKIVPDEFNYAAARPRVEALHRAGQLNEAAIGQYAGERKFEETVIGLSLLCEVSIDVVERALLSAGSEVLLILVKLAGFSWNTAKIILQMKGGGQALSPRDLDAALTSFSRLNVGTARKVLGFYNMRSEGFAAAIPGGR